MWNGPDLSEGHRAHQQTDGLRPQGIPRGQSPAPWGFKPDGSALCCKPHDRTFNMILFHDRFLGRMQFFPPQKLSWTPLFLKPAGERGMESELCFLQKLSGILVLFSSRRLNHLFCWSPFSILSEGVFISGTCRML